MGVITEEHGLHIGLQEEAMLLSSSLRHFLECYWVAAHTLKSTFEQDPSMEKHGLSLQESRLN